MKAKFVFIIALVSILGCSPTKMIHTKDGRIHRYQKKEIRKIQRQLESFYYKGQDIYHVSGKMDTTLLNWGDLRILQIDSLQDYYLKFRTEIE